MVNCQPANDKDDSNPLTPSTLGGTTIGRGWVLVLIYETGFVPQALRVPNLVNRTRFGWIRVRKLGHVVSDWDTSNPEHVLIRTLRIWNVSWSGHFESGTCPDQDTSNPECVMIFRHESGNQEPTRCYKGIFPHSICKFTCLVCCGC